MIFKFQWIEGQIHKFWKYEDFPSFEMIPSDEAERVAEIAENTGVSKFL